METFVTVIVTIAVIAVGVLLIHRLNSQHDDRIASFHYGHSGLPVAGPDPSAPRKAREWLRLRRRAHAGPPPSRADRPDRTSGADRSDANPPFE